MTAKLSHHKANDGSRLFAELPQTASFRDLLYYADTLEGLMLTGYLTDDVTEVWIDFNYMEHKFTINSQFGEYWFFAEDPATPDEILAVITEHFERFLTR